MKINTTRFGEINVPGVCIVRFENGLPGFARLKKYALIPYAEESPFYILQSVSNPDLTLLLDVDVEKGLSRRHTGGGEWNRLDDYELAFHKRVRDGYLELAAAEPQRWKLIDAGLPPQQVQEALQKAVLAKLNSDPRG